MKNEDILYYALREYLYCHQKEIRKARKTLRRVRPKPMLWYEELLNSNAEINRLWKQVNRLDVMLEVNKLPGRFDL